MTTTDFQITDTASGQQLAVSDVHAALAEPAAAHTDHTPPLPITDSMDRWAYERWGMSIDAYLRETWAEFDAVSRSLDEKGLPPMTPAPPEPQWADLPDDPPLKPHPAEQLTQEKLDADHAAWVQRAQAKAALATRVQQATERQARHDDDWRGQGQVPAQQHPDQPVHRKPRLLGLVDRFIAWHKQRQEQA